MGRLPAPGFKNAQIQSATIAGAGNLSGTNAFTLRAGVTYTFTACGPAINDDDSVTLKYGTTAPSDILDGRAVSVLHLPIRIRALSGQTDLSILNNHASSPVSVFLAEEF